MTEEPKPVHLHTIPIVSFKIEWEPQPEEPGKLLGAFVEESSRDWVSQIGKMPDSLVETGPPDSMLGVLENAVEKMDLMLGLQLAAINMQPEKRRLVADELLRAVVHLMTVERAMVGVEAGKTKVPNLDLKLDSLSREGFASISQKEREEVADALLYGLCHSLIVERSIRSRSLLETHAINLQRAIANMPNAVSNILGREIVVAALFVSESPEILPEQPVAQPEKVKARLEAGFKDAIAEEFKPKKKPKK